MQGPQPAGPEEVCWWLWCWLQLRSNGHYKYAFPMKICVRDDLKLMTMYQTNVLWFFLFSWFLHKPFWASVPSGMYMLNRNITSKCHKFVKYIYFLDLPDATIPASNCAKSCPGANVQVIIQRHPDSLSFIININTFVITLVMRTERTWLLVRSTQLICSFRVCICQQAKDTNCNLA